ncbi:GNAT family N-acetyltransferase [Flavobacterium subsaxonicum]|uniref:Acetyltransferase n=1 Tax=Flavobacterium subsaxonicum WB 4.1-42 = DSM 21790 TaxID=1121898 RepID=A0A0A2MYH8_9FLAO|nr:GNAT family N-acetyltransferase [Flavobacterium subsaxonicum]KGO93270.1 acetyltransferase [Flavobacterium subsaxonicum WB 4.1-42 = DSM 21790]
MEQTSITYKKASEADIPYLLQLREQTMTEHLVSSGLEATTENNLQRIHYHFDDAKIILLNATPVGLLKVAEHIDAIEIIQIQIAPEFQGKGIGKAIISQILSNANSKNLPVTLSVLKTNKALNLYLSLDFVILDENTHSYIMRYK